VKDKVVIVTGGGRGIGKAIALSFAREQCRLVLAARTKSEIERVANEVEQLGGEAVFVPTDVSREDDVQNMVKKASETFGRIDVLINNAGFGIFSKVAEMKTRDFQSMFDVNVRGVFFLHESRLAIHDQAEGWGYCQRGLPCRPKCFRWGCRIRRDKMGPHRFCSIPYAGSA
jgi:NAD(P)-dependent dehydrogenase (short-subunit alcohol dehydrogenase family)